MNMRALVFVAVLVTGWAAVPTPAECRRCSATRCAHDSACGPRCHCLFEDGRTNKKGRCVQIGD